MQSEEIELVRRAQSGDRAAFDKLVTENKDKMFALLYRMTANREIAKDLLQDTFLAAYKSIKKFRGDAGFSSWLYRIASNRALNHIRRSRLVPFINIDSTKMPEPAYEMPDELPMSELQKTLSKEVNNLPPQQKLVFNLRFHDELPFNDIAGILGKNVSTVKTHYQKAVEKLRIALKDFRN